MREQEVVAPTRRLRVGLIAPPWVPVPPPVYGGTERVIDELARGLVRAGCDVVLFTTGDSTCSVPRRSLYPAALGTVADQSAEQAHVERAYEELRGVDVIHDHTLTGPLWVGRPFGGPPVATTMHGELLDDLRVQYAAAAARVSIVAISHAQRRSAPEVPVAAVIHHGIDLASSPIGPGDGDYVAFVGRMSQTKGAHRAILAARAVGRRILLAAKMWEPEERRYFAEVVEPLLGPDAEYVGEVGTEAKFALLRGAVALVNPIRWPEPFGLVMIEAMLCGTPVLSFFEGSAPEIIDHGRTGFLCRDEADMAEKLGLVGGLDRAACRASVEARFSIERMVADHLELYHRMLAPAAEGGAAEDRTVDLTDASDPIGALDAAGPPITEASGRPPVPSP